MTYIEASNRLENFIESNFKSDLVGEKPIIFINGPFGVGKSHLVKEIIDKYSNKNINREKDDPIYHTIYCSLAGKSNIKEVEDELLSVKKFKKILSRLLDCFTLSVGYNSFFSINFDPQSLTNKKIKFKDNEKVIFVIDEFDRKCDILDSNAVFGFIDNITNLPNAKKYLRVIVVGNLDSIRNENDFNKVVAFKDKICFETLFISERKKLVLDSKLNLNDFDKNVFPLIPMMKKSARVLNNTYSIIKNIPQNTNKREKQLIIYLVMCYFYNNECSFFKDYLKNVLEKTKNANPVNDTILLTDKYEFALYKFFKRNNDYKSIIEILVPLVSYGTLSRDDADFYVKLVEVIKQNIKIGALKPFANCSEPSDIDYINLLKSRLNTNFTVSSNTNIPTVNQINKFTKDLYFISSNLHREYPNFINKNWLFPKEYNAFKLNSGSADYINCIL